MTNEEALSMLKMRLTLHDDDKDIFSDEMKKVLEKDKEAIKMAISALEHDRWIPVTERLPEEKDHILVTDGKEVLISWGNGMYKTPEGMIEIPAHYGNGLRVIAWRPLPEPCRESEGEHEQRD